MLCVVLALSACKKAPTPEPEPQKAEVQKTKTAASAAQPSDPSQRAAESAKAAAIAANRAAAQQRKQKMLEQLGKGRHGAKPVATVPVTPGDPTNGEFTLTQATQGISGSGTLIAELQTSTGNLSCELYEDKAPITVANFIGLARGLRPWLKDGKWVKQPLYDGTPFHRVIKGFMIQGGDPAHNGSGGPGYVIPDEIWQNARHDTRGLLCMANRGANTNGSQFFILDGKAPHLDGGYTIFGKCSPEDVIEKIANTEAQGDRAVNPPKIKKVVIKRQPGEKTAATSTASAAPAAPASTDSAPTSAPAAPKAAPAASSPGAATP